MTKRLDSLDQIAAQFDAIVLDQWGVLHNGSSPYPEAISCLERLSDQGHRLAVLSNSGKRAQPNLERIAAMGFKASLFETVMTSGEALWLDIDRGTVSETSFFPIERAAGDAAKWAGGLRIDLADRLEDAQAILLMGLPDDAQAEDYQPLLASALEKRMPVFCTNPDRASPRADGKIVVSPGALAHAFADNGGRVSFYGKPHLPVFRAIATALDISPDRLLMVGDSLEHDIAGADIAGWSSLFIESGLHAAAMGSGDALTALQKLVEETGSPAPDYTLASLQ